jgi:magnesium transporter
MPEPIVEPSASASGLSLEDLRAAWPLLTLQDRLEAFRLVSHENSEDFFLSLGAEAQAFLLLALPAAERRVWMRLLPPDDAADLVQAVSAERRLELLTVLDEPTRKEVSALLAYAEDQAGGLMSPRFARLRPDMFVDEAIAYLRRQAPMLETVYYIFVVDPEQRLLGVVSFRELFSAGPNLRVQDIMHADVVTAHEHMDQEELGHLFAMHRYLAIPVVDDERRVKGIVTMDDIVDVVREEATEDIHKLGGMAALEAPYLQIDLRQMIRKRAGWLSALFLGEMLTATAMSYYEEEIARAVVLALFVPLIISSGGNSGSQATTLVIRAMALGEIKLRDWWRVIRREFVAGLCLGAILGVIGVARIVLWHVAFGLYGANYMLIAITVGLSLVGVVLWGTVAGSTLPFILRRLGFDPASASAPFVATLVDVSGLLIYFTTATIILSGTLL